MWVTGIPHLMLVMADAKTVFVSPCTITVSGLIEVIIFARFKMTSPVCVALSVVVFCKRVSFILYSGVRNPSSFMNFMLMSKS